MAKIAEVVDFVESFDNAHRCPTYHTLQEEWRRGVISEFPWSEIEESGYDEYDTALDGTLTLFKMFLDKATSKRWAEKTGEERLAHIEALVSRPHVPQRSAEWYLQSKNVLTASEFSVILGTPRGMGQCALKKVIDPSGAESMGAPKLAVETLEMSPMDWGVRFEPVVKMILTAMWGSEIMDVGRIIHATDPRLAASPDGLLMSATDPARVGRLVEIKCPVRREMNGKIPFEYWCQMQIQMEVTDIDECDYIEVKIVSPYKEALSTYKSPEEGSIGCVYRGTVWLLQEPDTLELKYAYTYIELKDFERLGWNVIESIPWHMDSFYTETVKRDRHWFASTEEKRTAFWAAVKEAREGTFVLPVSQRPSKPKASELVVNVCKIMDD